MKADFLEQRQCLLKILIGLTRKTHNKVCAEYQIWSGIQELFYNPQISFSGIKAFHSAQNPR